MEKQDTPLSIIATVSRVVTRVVDRITGDRVDCPLLVATGCTEALKLFGIESRVMYGQSAWIEILEDHTPVWAGCWGENYHFWVATQYGEVVDLNASIAHRKPSPTHLHIKAVASPPMLWSKEVPSFYKYTPEGIAETSPTEAQDQKRLERVLSEIRARCTPDQLEHDESRLEFANEPILCPGRRVLDDAKNSFKHFERALAVQGIEKAPF
jgi:hypothetical protein